MRPLRIAATAFLFGGLFPVAAVAPAACAAPGPSATLVVDTEQGGDAYRYCVALPDPSVTGIELIELANDQHGLDYRLGYGGNVVCMLAGVGYASDECLTEGDEFWGYWRGDGSGGWEWSGSGANSTSVEDGDVEGWAWGTGNDGSSHPAPPVTTFASVCGRASGEGDNAGEDDERGGGRTKTRSDPNEGASGKGTDASASIPAMTAQGDATREGKPSNEADDDRDGRREAQEKDKKPGRGGDEPSPTAAPTSVTAADPVSFSDEGGAGIPAGAIVAIVAGAACLGGAVFLRRRRARAG